RRARGGARRHDLPPGRRRARRPGARARGRTGRDPDRGLTAPTRPPIMRGLGRMRRIPRMIAGRAGSASLSSRVVQVVELWRFPVKSCQGEQLDAVDVGPDGIVGDRAYALFDLDTGFGLTARRVPELLLASARLVEGDLVVTLPDGTESTDARVLSDWLGR